MTLHINQFSESIFSASLFRKHKPKIFSSPRIFTTPKRTSAPVNRILLPSGLEGKTMIDDDSNELIPYSDGDDDARANTENAENSNRRCSKRHHHPR